MVKKAAQARPNELLRAVRKERGWTQKDVADRINAPLSLNVTRWERGTAFPSAHYVEKLCQLFGKSASELGLIQERPSELANPANDIAAADTQLLTPARPAQRQSFVPAPKIFLLAGLALLLVAAGAGLLFSMTHSNHTIVHPTPTPKPASATAYPDPYPPRTGKLAFYDPLTEPYLWQNETNNPPDVRCQFLQRTYHITISRAHTSWSCFNLDFDAANITIEVQMKITQGDCGGLVVRSNEPNDYQFTVCQNGSYNFAVYKDYTSLPRYLVDDQISPAIIVGLNRLNVIAVVANGSVFDLYVNRQKIATVHDSSYSHGEVGLIGMDNQPGTTLTEVVYSGVKMWKLP